MSLFSTIARISGALMLLAVMAGLGFLGWRWMMATPADHIEVLGARHAEPDTLLAIARIDTGMRMVDIEPHLVENRLRRHPWVQQAAVTRRPTGTVTVHVQERAPAALRLDRNGGPDYYLDPYGFMMPHLEDTSYNVPLLRGFAAPYHPTQPVGHAPLQELLIALANAPGEIERLVSDIEWRGDGEIWLTITPSGDERAVPVRLGNEDFDARLRRLHAFYEQAVRTQPDMHFEWVDVRYETQVVTRETRLDDD